MKFVNSRSLVWMLWLSLPLLGVARPSASTLGAKDVRIPIYCAGRPEPAAIIHIKQIYKEHQRHGFFRIGALPLWVAQDVQIQLLTSDPHDPLLPQVSRALGPQNASLRRSLELRSLQVRVPHSDQPRLEAARVRINQDGSWNLLGGVLWRCGSDTYRADQATLLAPRLSSGGLELRFLSGTQEVRTVRLLEAEVPFRP